MRTTTLVAHFIWVFLSVVFAGVFLALGIFLIIAPCREEFRIDSFMVEHWLLSMIIGGLMIVVFFAYLIAVWRRNKHEQSISFDNPDGTVEIAVHAMEESVSRLVTTFPEVKNAYPSINATNEGLDAIVKVVLWDDSNVHSISQKIQAETKAHITNFFGVANISNVKVFVSGTARRAGSSKTTPSDTDASGDKSEGSSDVQF